MADRETKREALAALVARDLDPGGLEALDAGQRAELDRRVEALADGFDPSAPEPADPAQARLHRAVAAYRDARELRADEDNVRLAERGEVFAPEDDA